MTSRWNVKEIDMVSFTAFRTDLNEKSEKGRNASSGLSCENQDNQVQAPCDGAHREDARVRKGLLGDRSGIKNNRKPSRAK